MKMYTMKDIKWIRDNIKKYPTLVELHKAYMDALGHEVTYSGFYSFARRHGFVTSREEREERTRIIKQYLSEYPDLSTYKLASVMSADGYDWITAGKIGYIRKPRQQRLELSLYRNLWSSMK